MKRTIARKWNQRFPAILACWLVLVLCLTLSPPTRALEEGKPCPPESTNMVIEYGDLVLCSIDVPGDTDVFCFDGSDDETVAVNASRQGGTGMPCIELFAPDGASIGWTCSIHDARIDATLDQTGPHTILMWESQNDEIVDYALALQCVGRPCVIVPIPDVSGCVKLKGSPLPNRKVILKQRGEEKKTTTTDVKGCYEFEEGTLIPGKKFKVSIKGPRVSQ